MPERTLQLEYPIGGQDRRFLLAKQKPFTTWYEKNMRSDDADQGQLRGGSRPGLIRAFAEELDSGSPIWMLGQVREVTAAGGSFWEDQFNGVQSSAWSAAIWKADGAPVFYADGYVHAVKVLNKQNVGLVHTALADLDVSAEYIVKISGSPFGAGEDWNSTYDIFIKLDDTTPDYTQDGIRAWCTDAGSAGANGQGTIGLAHYTGGVETARWTDTTHNGGEWTKPWTLTLKITEGTPDTVTVLFNGAQIFSETITHKTGTRTGLGLQCGTGTLSKARIDYFRINYTPVGGEQLNRNRVLAATRTSISASKLYRENNDSTLAVVANGPMQVFKEGVVQAVEFLGKLYWTATGSAGKIQEYTPSTDTIADITVSGGTVPTKCRAIGVFQSRLVVAGPDADVGADSDGPHIWYMSKYADPTNWDYGASATLVGRAVAGTTADQTKIGQPILAFAAASDDYAIFGCISSLWLLRGNPAMGGTISPLSKEIGIIQNMAWCPLPDGGLAFMSRDGLYLLPPGGGAVPQSVSREKLPRELVDLDNENNAILMAYDPRARGIHIAVTPLETATGIYYFLNLQTGAFHPVTLQSDHEPLAMMTYHADAPSQAGVLYGCRDGYVRMFSNAAKDDDGTAMICEVDYGPIPFNRGRLAMADSLEIVLDDDASDVAWAFRSGKSPEEAYLATARASGTAEAGVNYRQSVRHSGQWGFLRFSTTAVARWAVESVKLRVLTAPAEERKI